MRDDNAGAARGLAIGSLKGTPGPTVSTRQVSPQKVSPQEAPPRNVSPLPRGGSGIVLDVATVGPSVRIFRVGRPEGFVFQAGQSMKLGLGRNSVRRRYSIASAPHEEHLEFCIEGVPGGLLTSLLFELVPGEPITLAPEAKGSFLLRADRRRHVMVATVTGIAPLRSMLRQALHRARSPHTVRALPSGKALRGAPTPTRADGPAEFWVLHGASYADELPYADELAALASQDPRVHYLPTVSRPGATRNQRWSGNQGRVDGLVLPTLRTLGPKHDVAVYACGNPEMVRTVRETLEPLGYLVLAEAYD